MSLADRVRTTITGALERLADEGAFGPPAEARAHLAAATGWTVERPKRAEHGDLATNVAMALTKRLGKPPRAIAEALVKALAKRRRRPERRDRRPRLREPPPASARAPRRAPRDPPRRPGLRARAGATGERIDLEFVSANPTGPLLVATGAAPSSATPSRACSRRRATASRASTTSTISATRCGSSPRACARSPRGSDARRTATRGRTSPSSRAGFEDDRSRTSSPETADALARTCVTWMLRGIPGSERSPASADASAICGVDFDVWFSEESLHRWGRVGVALRQLEAGGYLVSERRRALLPARRSGTDDKDRVVQKCDGAYTYFASRHRLLRRQDLTRLRPPDDRPRRRPPRLRRARPQRARARSGSRASGSRRSSTSSSSSTAAARP